VSWRVDPPVRDGWEREDPGELRRLADEWEKLGYAVFARHLRAWAAWHDGTGPRPRRDMRPAS
jgi:hypothetical protein